MGETRHTPGHQRHITLWRTRNNIDWDFYISESEREAGEVMGNLSRQGITTATTYVLGAVVPSLTIAPTPATASL